MIIFINFWKSQAKNGKTKPISNQIKFALSTAFLIVSIQMESQVTTKRFEITTLDGKKLGINHLTKQSVNAREIAFLEDVISIDSLSPNLIGMHLSTYGILSKDNYVVFDVKDFTKKWMRSIKVSKNAIWAIDGRIVDVTNNTVATINLETGKAKSILKFKQIAYNESNHIIFGYELDKEDKPAGKLKLLDLDTGKFIGSAPILYKAGMESFELSPDSLLYVFGSGIHKMNLQTGETYSHIETTHIPAKLGLVLKEEFLGHWGTWSKRGAVYPFNSEYVHFLTSNLLVDNGTIYKADARQLYALDSASLREKWVANLDDKHVSFSYLSMDQDNIYVLSTGTAFYKGLYFKYSNPYLYKFTKSGEKVYETLLDYKSRPIYSKMDSTTMIIGFGEKLARYDLTTGAVIKFITTDMMNIKAFRGSADSSVYYLKDDKFFCVKDEPEIIFLLSVDKLYKFNKDLFLTEKIDDKSVFRSIGSYKNYELLYGNKQLILLDDYKKVIEFDQIEKYYLFGNNLYLVVNGNLFLVDLDKELGLVVK